MKARYSCAIQLIFCLALAEPVSGQGNDTFDGNFIDLSVCDIVIAEATVVDKIKSGRRTIRAHDRHLDLVVVKLQGRAPVAGTMIHHPASFGVICNHAGEAYSAVSRGVGMRFTAKSGEEKEFWSLPAKNAVVSSSQQVAAGDEIILYVAVDLPEDADAFFIQLPSMIPTAGTVDRTSR